jgi:hypothetical protein
MGRDTPLVFELRTTSVETSALGVQPQRPVEDQPLAAAATPTPGPRWRIPTFPSGPPPPIQTLAESCMRQGTQVVGWTGQRARRSRSHGLVAQPHPS